MMMLKKVTYKEQVYNYLKEEIIKGNIVPGEIYSEQIFADQLQISRTPVREAILQLKSEGLVEIFNNRGIGIRAISLDELQQILQARTAIEGFSVHYLAERIHTPEGQRTQAALQQCLDQTEALSQDMSHHYEYMKADVNFHRIIVEFTRNRFFIRLIDQMRTRMEQATVNSLTLKNRHINALKEHQKIFRCICAGSGDDAVEAYRDHMAITMEILKKTGLV
jgi:DNA-binding GntR family transcriptional regulator